MAFDAGSIVATLRAQFDRRGFDQFDAAVAAADKKKATATLAADVQRREFDEFDAAVRAADKKRAEAALGAKIDDLAFKDFAARVAKADRAKATAELKADLDRRGFTEFAAATAAAGNDAKGLSSTIDVLTGSATAAGDAFGGAGGGSGLTARVGFLGGAMGPVSAVLAAGAPIMLALAGAATALAGSLAAAAAGAGAVGVGIGAALGPLALLGGAVVQRVGLMSEAFKALGAEQTKSGASAASSAEQQHAAALQIKSAEEGVADAHRTVARAQEDLTAARARAKREVEDLDAAVQHATLNEKAAHLALKEALKRLTEVQFDPKASILDIEEAQQAVAEARQGIEDTRRARQRATEDAKRGTDTVRKAQEQVNDAVRAEKRAVEALAEAHRSASSSAGAAGAAAVDAQQKMGQLSKTERTLVLTLRDAFDVFTKTFRPATDAIFRGFNDGLQKLTPLLGQFKGRFKGIGEDIGDVIRRAAGSLSGPEWTRAFDSFVKTSRQLVKPVSSAVGSVMEILRDIAVAAQPFVVEFAHWMQRALGSLAEKTSDASRMSKIIGGLVEHTKSWARFTGQVVELFFRIFSGGAKDGQSLVDMLTRLVGKWNDFLATKDGQARLQRFFDVSIRLTIAFTNAMAKLVSVFYKLTESVSDEVTKMANIVAGAFDVLTGVMTLDFRKTFDGLKTIASNGFKLLVEFFKLQAKPLRSVAAKLWDVLPESVQSALSDVKAAVASGLRSIVGFFKSGAVPVRSAFSSIWRGFAGIASGAFDGVLGVVRKALDGMLGVASTGVDAIAKVAGGVASAFGWVPGVGGKLKGLRDGLKDVSDGINGVRESLRKTSEQHESTGRSTDRLRGKFGTLRTSTDSYRDAASKARDSQDKLNTKIIAARGATDKARGGVTLLSRSMTSVGDAFDTIGAGIALGFNSLATQFGIKQVRYRAAAGQPPAGQGGGPTRPAATGKIARAELGGWVGNPGEAGPDTELFLLGRGEAVLNRHQQAAINALLADYGTSVNDIIGSIRRPHYAAEGWPARGPGNSLPQSLMTSIGGKFGNGQTIFPKIAGQVRSLIGKYHALVNAGWAPVGTHAANSDHHWGGAVDLQPGDGGSWDMIDRLAAWAEPSQNRPAHGFRWVGYNGDPNHGRGNHLHLSWPYGRLIKGVQGGDGIINAPKVTGPASPWLEALRAAGKKLAEGAQSRIDQAMGSVRPVASIGPPLPGRTYTASEFGGHNDPSAFNRKTASGAIANDSLIGFAELSNNYAARSGWDFSALGNLKMGTRLRISHGNRSMVAPKVDKGRGGPGRDGHPRAIDLTYAVARRLGLNGLGLVRVQKAATGKAGTGRWWPPASYSGTVFKKRTVNTPDDNPTYDLLTRDVSDLQRLYTQAERRYNQTDEILIDPRTGLVNIGEVRKRVAELDDLVARAKQIWDKILEKVAFARRIAQSYAQTASQLVASLRFARKKDRSGIQAEANAYRQASQAWSREATEAGFDATDAELFYYDQVNERDTVANTKSDPTLANDPATSDPADSGGGGYDSGSSGGGSSAPSAEDIAAAARQMLASFNANRAELFGGYGSNFVTAGSRAIYDPTTGAAGFRHFGAVPGGAFEVAPAAAGGGAFGGGVKVTNNYAAPPPDPHTWSRGIEFELQSIGR